MARQYQIMILNNNLQLLKKSERKNLENLSFWDDGGGLGVAGDDLDGVAGGRRED